MKTWEPFEHGWGARGNEAVVPAERKERKERKDATERAAVMAAHQMPTTASGMLHPSAVMASQYAHSQPQVLPNFYLALNDPETTKFGQEMRFCGGGEEASEKRERIIVVLVFVVVVVSACARCRTVVEVLLASYSVVLINAFLFLYVCFLSSTASLPARTETAAASFLATADARDRASERSKLLRNCLYYLLFLVLYLSRIFS